MKYTVAEHYGDNAEAFRFDQRMFDGDLRTIFVALEHARRRLHPISSPGTNARSSRAIVLDRRNASIVRQFVDFLADRAAQLG